jgi:hypothetical protein
VSGNGTAETDVIDVNPAYARIVGGGQVWEVRVAELERSLATLGLHIIDAKAKAVLDACAKMPDECRPGYYSMDWMNDVTVAEMARRSPPTEPGAE